MGFPRTEQLTAQEGQVLDAIRKMNEENTRLARVSNDQVRQYLEQVNHLLTGITYELGNNDRSSVDLARLESEVEQAQGIIYALLR